MSKKINNSKNNCECFICKNNIEFNLPSELLEKFLKGDIAIFAGSGISTESEYILPEKFYDSITYELGYKKCDLTFSKLMEKYCAQPDGRIKLLSKIKDRFDYVKSFPELHRNATRFHRELSTFFQIKTIITTNWDTFFEEECGATPFITSEDIAFWNIERRKVLKIHGSINNYGSIIATKSDYNKCLQTLHKRVLGSILKTILATKTLLFVGYSFKDEDFSQIFSFIKKDMKGLIRNSYIITLDKENEKKYKKLGLTPIYTDGTYFLSIIKKHAVHQKHILPDLIYDLANDFLMMTRQAHNELYDNFNCFNNPEIVYCAFYQDGIIHAYERMLSLKQTGEYSNPHMYMSVYETYEKKLKEFHKIKKYEDMAYTEGYVTALVHILSSIDKKCIKLPPRYYIFGSGKTINSFKQYKKLVKEAPKIHKSAYRRIKRYIRKYKNKDIVLHHPAYF